mmetsp:Transcript_90694/g.259107  ORF Transcript_90694/g.259107 Transcript_90694/m.259107 type:complete len:232 (-) Transcript_90694:918-1613(-)
MALRDRGAGRVRRATTAPRGARHRRATDLAEARVGSGAGVGARFERRPHDTRQEARLLGAALLRRHVRRRAALGPVPRGAVGPLDMGRGIRPPLVPGPRSRIRCDVEPVPRRNGLLCPAAHADNADPRRVPAGLPVGHPRAPDIRHHLVLPRVLPRSLPASLGSARPRFVAHRALRGLAQWHGGRLQPRRPGGRGGGRGWRRGRQSGGEAAVVAPRLPDRLAEPLFCEPLR